MNNPSMKKTTLGPSGIECSAIGLGTWAMGGWMWGGGDNAAAVLAIQASLDAGVTLIDTAPAYGLGRSESIVGTALKGRRQEAVIATKCGLVWHTQTRYALLRRRRPPGVPLPGARVGLP
jgi:methylglyoxal reductase